MTDSNILDLIENIFSQGYDEDSEIDTEALDDLNAAIWAELTDREAENGVD